MRRLRLRLVGVAAHVSYNRLHCFSQLRGLGGFGEADGVRTGSGVRERQHHEDKEAKDAAGSAGPRLGRSRQAAGRRERGESEARGGRGSKRGRRESKKSQRAGRFGTVDEKADGEVSSLFFFRRLSLSSSLSAAALLAALRFGLLFTAAQRCAPGRDRGGGKGRERAHVAERAASRSCPR